MNYYNEIDPYCAAWLQNLMDAGLIPAGHIDTRSIEDVIPNDLRGYDQCHFFTGIGGWPLALRLAGWPDSRPVWTGSCPCQPFSSAGKGVGFTDQRHLWPAWFHLIKQCNPSVIFGEQVASKAAEPWIDLVQADVEGMGYAFGCVPFPAASIGAPHIRDRNYWMAHLHGNGLEAGGAGFATTRHGQAVEPGGRAGRLGDALGHGRHQGLQSLQGQRSAQHAWSGDLAGGMGHSGDDGLQGRLYRGQDTQRQAVDGSAGCDGPADHHWAGADWVYCRDEKFRPVEPGTFPLAYGVSGRVGRLRAYGNAIVPQQAAEFIAAYAEARGLILLEMEVAA